MRAVPFTGLTHLLRGRFQLAGEHGQDIHQQLRLFAVEVLLAAAKLSKQRPLAMCGIITLVEALRCGWNFRFIN